MLWNVDLHLLEEARVRSLTTVTVSKSVFFFYAFEICFNREKPTAVNLIALDGLPDQVNFLAANSVLST
jgi:hypothetical protein